jgi:hypothetical protein
MKFNNICVFIVVILIFFSCGDYKPDKLPSSNQRKKVDKKQDTIKLNDEDDFPVKNLPFNFDSVIIIQKTGEEGDLKLVFIDNTNNPEYFTKICDFEMPTKFEIAVYRNSYNKLIKQKKSKDDAEVLLEKSELPRKWIPLALYSDEYYFYCPASPEHNYRVMITDSCLAVYDIHGVKAEVIDTYRKKTDNHFVLNVFALSETEKILSKEINIYIIDEEKNIAIWEEFYPEGIKYRLMIAVIEPPEFSVIVNYGQNSTPEEYKFEEINYFEEINEIVKEF